MEEPDHVGDFIVARRGSCLPTSQQSRICISCNRLGGVFSGTGFRSSSPHGKHCSHLTSAQEDEHHEGSCGPDGEPAEGYVLILCFNLVIATIPVCMSPCSCHFCKGKLPNPPPPAVLSSSPSLLLPSVLPTTMLVSIRICTVC